MTVVPNNKKIPSRVSIIVNAFNSARYLNQCIDSVLRQTYADIELIIIDDCSTDDTSTIINKRAKEDSRIKKVNLSENVGPYWSRMKGLPFVTGEYIGFVDSDDWIEPGMYEAMLKAALAYRASPGTCPALPASGNPEPLLGYEGLQPSAVGVISEPRFPGRLVRQPTVQ